ncbi:MAG TPA: hypothetical protein VGJ70_14695 [Solirubrobacteraceae bacterium]|jgi:hypothetical protein
MSTFACTLSQAEMPDRLAETAVLGRSLRSSVVTEGRAVLRFRGDADTRARAAAFVAAESVCCSFLSMELFDEPDALVLTVEGPEGAEPMVRELVAALTAAEQAR